MYQHVVRRAHTMLIASKSMWPRVLTSTFAPPFFAVAGCNARTYDAYQNFVLCFQDDMRQRFTYKDDTINKMETRVADRDNEAKVAAICCALTS